MVHGGRQGLSLKILWVPLELPGSATNTITRVWQISSRTAWLLQVLEAQSAGDRLGFKPRQSGSKGYSFSTKPGCLGVVPSVGTGLCSSPNLCLSVLAGQVDAGCLVGLC